MRDIESDYDLLNDPDTLQQRIDDGDSIAHIANDLGCMSTTVVDWVCCHDIQLPDESTANTESFIDELNDAERLRSMIVDDEMSVRDIADTLDVTHTATRRWLLRHGITKRIDKPSQKNVDESADHNYGPLSEAAWAQTDVAWRDPYQLRRAYWVYYWSMTEIADWAAYGPSRSLISDVMRDHDIEIRDASEAGTVRSMKQRGVPLERIRSEVPPPWERTDDATDMTVEWSRLSTAADD